MSEAQQESRLKIEVDPSTIIPEYRERVALLIDTWAIQSSNPVEPAHLFELAHEVRNLRSEAEGEPSESSDPQPGGFTPDDVVARRCVAKLLKEWSDKLIRAKRLEAEAKRLRHEADQEEGEVFSLMDRYY